MRSDDPDVPLSRCTRCPRLAAHHQALRRQYPEHHLAPVPLWGARAPRILLVGLAPGLHGAARTGRGFVGDASGRFLFEALHRVGLADSPDPDRAALRGTAITNVVKCLPPGNAPVGAEVRNCRSYLDDDLDRLRWQRSRTDKVVVALGQVAYKATARALNLQVPAFGHAVAVPVTRHVTLLASFHPSRLNVNTRRLTASMLDAVLTRAATTAGITGGV